MLVTKGWRLCEVGLYPTCSTPSPWFKWIKSPKLWRAKGTTFKTI